jgi:hypothetical protein
MERLDQGHLYLLLDHQSLTCPGRTQASAGGGEYSKKLLFKQLINIYSEHLHEHVT